MVMNTLIFCIAINYMQPLIESAIELRDCAAQIKVSFIFLAGLFCLRYVLAFARDHKQLDAG